MTPEKTTVKDFFANHKCFTIPLYQRAYSWERPQLERFLEDLEEAQKGKSQYFLDSILIEKGKKGKPVEIIDGQQRITTIVIFIRSAISILRESSEKLAGEANDIMNENGMNFEDGDETGIHLLYTLQTMREQLEKIEEIEKLYLGTKRSPKLKTVEYDDEFFRARIIGAEYVEENSKSQARIADAFSFFEYQLEVAGIEKTMSLIETLENSLIIQTSFNNKRDSILMFELQNDRGKKLTNMEKLKSYFSYIIYTYCGKEAESKLGILAKDFEEMYLCVNEGKFNEDRVISYFHAAEYGYEADDYKSQIKKCENEEKIEWIENYTAKLKKAFEYYKNFKKEEGLSRKLLRINKAEIFPFVIKVYFLLESGAINKEGLLEAFRVLEIMAFRMRFMSSRADITANDRLGGVLKGFDSLESLRAGLKKVCNSKYWSNKAVENKIDKEGYDSMGSGILRYIFIYYEEMLCKKSNVDYNGFSEKYDLEHIAPQKQCSDKDSGYSEYDKDFKENYLNCIGNLTIIKEKENAEARNHAFSKKLKIYNNSPLLQQKEIQDFATNKDTWDKEAINKRKDKLKQFVLETWSF